MTLIFESSDGHKFSFSTAEESREKVISLAKNRIFVLGYEHYHYELIDILSK